MTYRELHGYKYELMEDVCIPTKIKGPIVTKYGSVLENMLIIRDGYAWDGPSGPTIDTATFMRGSLVHDFYYQLMREGRISAYYWREYADQELRRICIEDGMNKFRAWYVYWAVRIWGHWTCKPRKNPRGKVVTI